MDGKIVSAKTSKSSDSLDGKLANLTKWSDASDTDATNTSGICHLEFVKEDTVSGEETEDASEDGDTKSCNQAMKEQMYFRELELLKASLQELKYGRHPDFVRGLAKIEEERAERLRRIEAGREYEASCIERDFMLEKNLAILEFEEKKNELKGGLIDDLEQKKLQIVNDVFSMDLALEGIEVAPSTRRLRSRPNEQFPMMPGPEEIKRRKPRQTFLKFYLSNEEIQKDLDDMERAIEKEYGHEQQGSPNEFSNNASNVEVPKQIVSEPTTAAFMDSRIEDGKLFYEKKWFHRGQPVFVEGIDLPTKVSGVISSISQDTIWIRKVADQSRLRVMLNQLIKGHSAIKRRA